MKPYENPFRTEKLNTIPFIFNNEETIETLYADFKVINCVAAITGPKGSGKSRLTELLRDLMLQDGLKVTYTRLSADHKKLDPSFQEKLKTGFSSNEIIILDGCEQLNLRQWLTLKKKIVTTAKGLLITTHKKERLPTLRTCTTSPELLIKLTEILTENRVEFDNTLLRKLYKKHNQNIRDALLELYDKCTLL